MRENDEHFPSSGAMVASRQQSIPSIGLYSIDHSSATRAYQRRRDKNFLSHYQVPQSRRNVISELLAVLNGWRDGGIEKYMWRMA